MKNFRMIALMGLVLMTSLVMTSCLSGKDGDNKSTQNVIVLYENGTLKQYGGETLIPENTSYLPSAPGIYSIGIEYDPTTWSGDKLNVKLTSAPVSLNNYNVVSGSAKGNINMYDLNYNGEMYPFMFNEDYIMVPYIFWMENVSANDYSAEEKKHHFYLQAPEDLHTDGTTLELWIYDVVDDPEVQRNKSSYLYQAFNIRNLIQGFKAVNGAAPNVIRMKTMVNRSSYDPADQNTREEFYDITLAN